MIHENVELHNIPEVSKAWNGSFQLQRVPESVRSHLNDGAQKRSLASANAEIRFQCDSPSFKITLNCENQTRFRLAYGSFMSPGSYPLEGKLTVEIQIPENFRNLSESAKSGLSFDPSVVRILLPRQTVNFFSVEGENVRPPEPGTVPALRYLAYGTSITEGGCASDGHLNYVTHTARGIGADLINLGMSGSCHAEPEMADYIAGRDDWDIATLALSVNMLGFELNEFKKRVEYCVNTVAGANTNRPVACITLYPFSADVCDNMAPEKEKAEAFRQVLRDAVKNCPHPNVHLIEGPDILDQIDGLSFDMIHPSDYGMMRMGQNLSAALKPLIKG